MLRNRLKRTNSRFLLLLAAASLAAAAARVGAQECEWVLVATETPHHRLGHAMAYDSARGVVVLFGGRVLPESSRDVRLLSDTWEWNGVAWTQRHVSGPSARADHAMAFDSHRNVVVLFGGQIGAKGESAGDTWEWTGTEWIEVIVDGPEARHGHAMAFDSARGVTVLFGGRFDIFHEGTPDGLDLAWEWSGAEWRQVASHGPYRPIGHAMSYDSIRKVTVLFGGFDSFEKRGLVGDTWAWDGTEWSLLAEWDEKAQDGPGPREQQAMAFDVARGQTILYGGSDSALRTDT